MYWTLPWLTCVFYNCLIFVPKLQFFVYTSPRGGGLLSPKSYVDVPAGPRKSDYLYTNFLPNFPPITIPFSKERHPILIKLGAFYNNLPKIHPIYVIWAPSSLMKTPDRYTKFCEKAPQKVGTYTYTMSMWEPPPPDTSYFYLRIGLAWSGNWRSDTQ